MGFWGTARPGGRLLFNTPPYEKSFAEYEDQFDCFILAFLAAGKKVSIVFAKIDEMLNALKEQGWKNTPANRAKIAEMWGSEKRVGNLRCIDKILEMDDF